MNRRSCLSQMCWLALIAGGALATRESTPGAEPEKKAVTLIIDYGDGVEKRFAALTAAKDATVLDVLNAAQKHARGIRFEYKGKGETGLLTQIDDVKNEGAGRNWIFRVNDKLGDRSFAISPVQAGDVVLWKFAEYK